MTMLAAGRAWLRLYGTLVVASLKARAIYRFNYVVSILMQMILGFSELALILLVLHKVHTIGGWSADDITFLFGLVSLSSGVYRVFASEFHDFDKYLVDGEFDAVLTRPAPALLTMMAKSIDVEHAGRLILGSCVVVIESIRLGGVDHFSLWTGFGIVYAIACGSFIWIAMVITVATLGFWTTRVDDFQPVFLYGPETAASYPLNIYPRFIQMVFYTVMPVGFGSYVPAALILHKGLPQWMWAMSGLMSGLALIAAIGFWTLGVRRYASTGT